MILVTKTSDQTCVFVCVCVVIPFILEDRFVDVPVGVTQEEGHTEIFTHLPSAVLALIFFARRIQPLFFPSTVKLTFVCVCVVCFLTIYSGHQVRWTNQLGSHRRKVTQDFSSTFLLRCVPDFFSRE